MGLILRQRLAAGQGWAGQQNGWEHVRLCLTCLAFYLPAHSQQVALPELDGGMEPIVFAGRDSATGKSHSLPDRIDALCARAINWANLSRKKNAEKKLVSWARCTGAGV